MGAYKLTNLQQDSHLRIVHQNNSLRSYRYGFQGSESDDEIKGTKNSYTTHFRQLDVRIGKWLSLDPKMEKFPSISPYTSMDNNPIWFNDIKGDSINTRAIYNSGDKELVAGFETFAKSKEGIAFLSQYAEAGQIIAGHKYEKDGKFVKDKINLNLLGRKTVHGGGAWGWADMNTEIKDVNGYGNLNIVVAYDFGNQNYSETQQGDYYNSLKKEGQMTKAKNFKELAITKTFFHEVLIHGVAFTKDYEDNGKIDYSPFPKGDKGERHHKWAYKNAQTSSYGRSYYDIIKRKKALAPNITDTEIWNWMFGIFPESLKKTK